jgi:PP-loop superfamily ATP-utilizing enzyme
MTSYEKFKLQEEFCKEKKLPLFSSQYCYFCKKDIYEHIDVEKAKSTLITGCPCCHRSFVD